MKQSTRFKHAYKTGKPLNGVDSSAIQSNMTENTENMSFVDKVLNPNRVLSQWLFGLGLWGLMLGILNLMVMLRPEEKVVWAGFLSLGKIGGIIFTEKTSYAIVSDSAFLFITGGSFALGSLGLHKSTEGGITNWVRNLFMNDYWKSLVNPQEEGGWMKTISAWCLVIGFVFYLYWGVVHTGWIDTGVYAVSIVFIAFGFSLKFASENSHEEADEN